MILKDMSGGHSFEDLVFSTEWNKVPLVIFIFAFLRVDGRGGLSHSCSSGIYA
jgi:hypothetical protein